MKDASHGFGSARLAIAELKCVPCRSGCDGKGTRRGTPMYEVQTVGLKRRGMNVGNMVRLEMEQELRHSHHPTVDLVDSPSASSC